MLITSNESDRFLTHNNIGQCHCWKQNPSENKNTIILIVFIFVSRYSSDRFFSLGLLAIHIYFVGCVYNICYFYRMVFVFILLICDFVIWHLLSCRLFSVSFSLPFLFIMFFTYRSFYLYLSKSVFTSWCLTLLSCL